MPLATIRARVLQPLDVIQNLTAQIVLNLHFRERRGEIEDLLVGQLADFASGMDMEPSHQARGD